MAATNDVMESTAVSAGELVRVAQTRSQALVTVNRADKLCRRISVTDYHQHEHRLRARLHELNEQLTEPFVGKRSDLYTADWDPTCRLVRICSIPGRYWLYMGFQNGRHKFLHWQEALMLCDMGVLLLRAGGHVLSMQEARIRLLQDCPALERQYRVYCHLTRLGYRPLVTQLPSLHTDYERRIRLDQYTLGSSKRRHPSNTSPSVTDITVSRLHVAPVTIMKFGGATVMFGDTTVRFGDTTVRSGDTTVRSGGATVMFGDRTVMSGDTTMVSGNATVRSGVTKVMSGDTALMSGDTTVMSCDTTVMSGDTKVMSGDTKVMSGDTTVMSGDTTMVSGNATVMSGDTTVMSGDTTVMSGDTKVMSGDTKVMSSDTTVRSSDVTVMSGDTTVRSSDATVRSSDATVRSSHATVRSSDATVMSSDATVMSSDSAAADAGLGLVDDGGSTGWSSVGFGRCRLSNGFLRRHGLMPLSEPSAVLPPPAQLLPSGVRTRNDYFWKRPVVDVASDSALESRADFCSPLPRIKGHISNWTAYKAEVDRIMAACLTSGVTSSGSLTAGDWCGPVSARIEQLRLGPVMSAQRHVTDMWQRAVFHVHDVATCGFRKSRPPMPLCSVTVVSADSCFGEAVDVASDVDAGEVPTCVAVAPPAGAPALYTVEVGTVPVDRSLSDFDMYGPQSNWR